MKRLFFVLCAALALTVGVSTASAGGGNSDAAHACQQGKWQYIVRSDGTPFKNQGDCVSYAAQGGTLVPLPDLQLSVSCTGSATAVDCVFHVKNAGVAPATGLIGVDAALQFAQNGDAAIAVAVAVGVPDCTGPGNDASVSFPSPPPLSVIAHSVCDGTIPPGATADVLEMEIAASSVGPTSFAVTAAVDPTNVIHEAFENNNTYSATFS